MASFRVKQIKKSESWFTSFCHLKLHILEFDFVIVHIARVYCKHEMITPKALDMVHGIIEFCSKWQCLAFFYYLT